MSETKQHRDAEDWLAERFTEQIQSVAGDLRALADAVDRASGDVTRVRDSKHSTYGAVAEAVLHRVHTELAGMKLAVLARSAGEADAQRGVRLAGATAETTPEPAGDAPDSAEPAPVAGDMHDVFVGGPKGGRWQWNCQTCDAKATGFRRRMDADDDAERHMNPKTRLQHAIARMATPG